MNFKTIIIYSTLAALTVFGWVEGRADSYQVSGSWVDDTPTGPAYVAQYAYRVYQDGVLVGENLTSATPTVSEAFTAPAGITVTVEMRNSNVVVTPPIEGNWSAPVVASLAEQPVDVVTSTVVVVHSLP